MTEMLNSPPKERDVMGSPLEADSCSMVAEHELGFKQSMSWTLRSPKGGLVKAGLDVAQILDGNETLVSTIDRDGIMAPINMANGHALTHDPLIVLISLRPSAQSSLFQETTLLEEQICQSVTELHDGFALFITVANCGGVQQTILVAFLMVLFRIFGIYSEAKDFTSI
ncbi:hypothetical protein RHMOL_Rhmol01G0021000 [Rhododendron molle]|uniref:Uncharacterized protein n=1 Tax=Rhododendron molle TaxID=49168 RepID=A0ACC0Q031_RHOML|nr:hypothetical protein RHMOL_Rhmol01G0021000 [Rhododendron molle]